VSTVPSRPDDERDGGLVRGLAHWVDLVQGHAVWTLALTTIASFGILVISAHRGVSSLGFLRVVGMIRMLAANLLLLPALLQLRASLRRA
jgi:predicted RND superfamily exporter protein